MKQTAVDQLINEMKSLLNKPYVNPKNALNDCINLAHNKLQMEKEQIIKAFCEGYDHDGDNYDGAEISYYNRTYKGGDK
jgi:hypothetical protein